MSALSFVLVSGEGGVEILCTDQDEGGGGDSSDGENSVASNASVADGEESGRKSASPPAKLSIVSPEVLMQR
jgi:hypothetical protein